MSPKPIDKQVSAREGYALWASHYDVHDNPMTTMVEHVLSQSSIDLGGAKVLELGCGTGRNARTLLNSGVGSYLGLDSSPEMLEVAGAAACDVIQFEERDLQGHWWTGLESFDLCLISLVLEHFENIEEVINAATHVVRPGGLLWILEIHSQLRGEGVQAHVT
ncbi:MAG: class I SAM-dependent methyltransferase, partial [Kofleriaceae bacterium]|nr:class I SAM-dependent methyltransferase [Kofleriaceae bacterium]